MKLNRQKVKVRLWIIWFAATSIFRKTYIANACKHRTKSSGATESFGERYVMGMPLAANGRPDYCLKCIGQMAIQCGWCGKSIHVGDMVTPYMPKPNMPAYAQYRQDTPKSPRTVIGCCRKSCRELPGDEHGQWIPPGKVERCASLIEQLAGAVEAGDDCAVLMVKAR